MRAIQHRGDGRGDDGGGHGVNGGRGCPRQSGPGGGQGGFVGQSRRFDTGGGTAKVGLDLSGQTWVVEPGENALD